MLSSFPEGNEIIDREKAKLLGDKAKEELRKFYIAHEVDPEIAQETSSQMLGEHLAGLTSGLLHHVKIDPNLRELQDEFSGLLQDGFNPSAVAILLTEGSFRFAYWRGTNKPFHPNLSEAERRGEALGRKYQELVTEGKEPISVARDIVAKTQEYYKRQCLLEKTETQLKEYERWLGLRLELF